MAPRMRGSSAVKSASPSASPVGTIAGAGGSLTAAAGSLRIVSGVMCAVLTPVVGSVVTVPPIIGAGSPCTGCDVV
jgi:hypothetical protein